jgi:hypothetical protein
MIWNQQHFTGENDMETRHVRVLNIDTDISPLQIEIPGGKECLIREIVVYYEEEDGCLCGKNLYMIADIEKHLGYRKHGWQQFKDRDYIVEINNKKFSDCETILSALKGCLVELKRKQRVVPNKSFSDELEYVLEGFLMEQKRCNIISLEETRIALSRVDTPKAIFKKQNAEAIDEIDTAKEANGNQMTEFMDTVHPGNDVADAFNDVFDSAKEITRYGELMHEGIQLTNEMSAMRVQIAELTQKLKGKELEFNNKQKEITEMKQSLANNPLLRLVETTSKEDDSDELKKKLERLEAENQSLKEEKQDLEDRLGEGENFKTASMFPNKEEYFIGDDRDIDSRIGLAAVKLATDNKIELPPKIRRGAEQVRIYPTQLLQDIENDIKSHNRNKYTVLLNSVLKAEYMV